MLSGLFDREVRGSGATLLSFFILRRTKVHKWMEDIWVVGRCVRVNQGDFKQVEADAL